jgi:hypothetical protein
VMRSHGMSGTREYRCWKAMKTRCLNPVHQCYDRYGGRGITVCDRWLSSFESFIEDMGRCPEGLTLERDDNDKGYDPGNCRWATRRDQQRNRRAFYSNKSGIKGVRPYQGKWRAYIDKIHLGTFETKEAAAMRRAEVELARWRSN